MLANQWLVIVAIGMIFGALGQGARTIVGFKKMYDYADDGNPASMLVDGVRLLISFGIGAVAGAFAAITLITDVTKPIPAEQLFAIAAAGYSGSDFIEGFISRISRPPGEVTPAATRASTSAAQAYSQQDDAVG